MIRNLANQIVTKLKGSDYKIDPLLPLSYLLELIFSKLLCMLYGMVRLRTFKRVLVHPSSVIKCSSSMYFGCGLNIERGCYIDALSKNGLVLGNNVSVGMNTTIRLSGSYKQIANGVKIGNNVGLGTHGYYGCGVGYLSIGNNCIFGNYVSIHPENHNFRDHTTPIRLQGVNSTGGVSIGDNCWIGTKATILDGTKIGNGCVVAAGAVVKGVFPDNVIIGGVPARIIKSR